MIKRLIESKQLIELKRLVTNKTKKAILVVILSVLLGALCGWGFSQLLPQQIRFVTFDMKGTLNTFMKEVQASHMPEAQKQVYIKAFFPAVAAATKAYAQKHHVVILSMGAVVGGNTPDVTHTLQQIIEQQLNAEVKP